MPPNEPIELSLRSGVQLGDYQILSHLVSGNTGEFWLALKKGGSGGQIVVAKTLQARLDSDQTFVERFWHHAMQASRLEHPGIAQLLDGGATDGAQFVIMEYVPGKSIENILQKQTIPPLWFSLKTVMQICEALVYAHAQQGSTQPAHTSLIHGCLSPKKVMVSCNGIVKILGFGLAQVTSMIQDIPSSVRLTRFAYLSPEHLRGVALDHRCDIYGVGVLLYELLTGARPFTGNSVFHLIQRISEGNARPITQINPSVPKELEGIVSKAMTPRLDTRYQSAGDLRNDLGQVLTDLGSRPSSQLLMHFLRDIFPEIPWSEKQCEAPIMEPQKKPSPPPMKVARPSTSTTTKEKKATASHLQVNAAEVPADLPPQAEDSRSPQKTAAAEPPKKSQKSPAPKIETSQKATTKPKTIESSPNAKEKREGPTPDVFSATGGIKKLQTKETVDIFSVHASNTSSGKIDKEISMVDDLSRSSPAKRADVFSLHAAAQKTEEAMKSSESVMNPVERESTDVFSIHSSPRSPSELKSPFTGPPSNPFSSVELKSPFTGPPNNPFSSIELKSPFTGTGTLKNPFASTETKTPFTGAQKNPFASVEGRPNRPFGTNEAVRHFEQGLIAFRGGNYHEALTSWEKANELDSENRTYRVNLQRLKALLEKEEKK